MPEVAERIELNIDGQTVIVERLDNGTFRKPDYLAGAEREVTGRAKPRGGMAATFGGSEYKSHALDITAPATPAAQQWDGWGTALKPAAEEWIVAMKPRAGTFAENALAWGVAGLNIDGARIPANGDVIRSSHNVTIGGNGIYGGGKAAETGAVDGRRWPANVVLDGEAAAMLDEQAGERPSGGGEHARSVAGSVALNPGHKSLRNTSIAPSTGGASRFFYCAKSSRRERNEGLPEGMTNGHPTVKPLALLRWLCRLTKTPTAGVVLDPFMGSGTTGMAAIMEGREFVGIELDADYYEIARRRIAHAAKQPRQLTLEGVQP